MSTRTELSSPSGMLPHGESDVSPPAPQGAPRLQWLPALILLAGLIVLARSLPLATGFDRLERWVSGLGLLGMVVFGGVYVVAALLFVPGAALTIAAGAVFGLVGGTATVSVASTTAAALAFVAARHLFRLRVEQIARRHRAFRAVDHAIGDGGWKIIALLRLVPLFPFSAGNYLLGLTSARFGSYVAASWAFMLPGTFLYVYIGFLGVASLEAASSADSAVGAGRVVLLGAGFLALVLATVYITRLAKRRLGESAPVEDLAADPVAVPVRRSRRGSVLLWICAASVASTAAWARANTDRLAGLFGPPVVNSQEAFLGAPATATFDHGVMDGLLRRFVSGDGLVDYQGLRGQVDHLDAYLASLAEAQLDSLGRDGRLALLINAYNAFTLRLILDHYPVASIRDIPADQRWAAQRWRLGGRMVSLDQIENEMIRPNFAEPRIHFALVCAAIGCPKLRSEAYSAERLEAQLADQARYVHSHDRWFRFDAGADLVELTQLYQWYATDFEQAAGSVLAFVARYVPALQKAVGASGAIEVAYLPYDWSLNVHR